MGRRRGGSGFGVDRLGLVGEEREETEQTMEDDYDREDGLKATRRSGRLAQGIRKCDGRVKN